ncbi:hypothetical protein V6N13_015941 [Hibiscus sabdariffa]|uniref:Uncharacterized protein n=1 Tax=Hibiscus sabdariffa TaxID=183260 RepID=A0ABR2CX59_9ROSI
MVSPDSTEKKIADIKSISQQPADVDHEFSELTGKRRSSPAAADFINRNFHGYGSLVLNLYRLSTSTIPSEKWA